MDFWKRVEEELEFQGKTKKELALLTNIKEQTLHKAFERRADAVFPVVARPDRLQASASVLTQITGEHIQKRRERAGGHAEDRACG